MKKGRVNTLYFIKTETFRYFPKWSLSFKYKQKTSYLV